MTSTEQLAGQAILLIALLAVLAAVAYLLRRRHSPRRLPDRSGPAVHSVEVGVPARQILDRAARLGPAELEQLLRGYRRLARYGAARSTTARVLKLLDGLSTLIQPIASGDRGPRSLLRVSETHALQAVGIVREQALLARATEAIGIASGSDARRRRWELARAVANAALSVDAADRLDADDRAILAWPWRDAIDHRLTIPDPGSIVPRRPTAVVAILAALLAVLAISGGSPPVPAIGVYLVLGTTIVAAVSLFRLMLWRPVLRVSSEPPSHERAGVDDAPRSLANPREARDTEVGAAFGPRMPPFARRAATDAHPVAFLLGVLVVGACWVVPFVEPGWVALAIVPIAVPGVSAGLLAGIKDDGLDRALVWYLVGAALAAVGSLVLIAAAWDAKGEMWPWLALIYAVVVAPLALVDFGVGTVLGRWLRGRRS